MRTKRGQSHRDAAISSTLRLNYLKKWLAYAPLLFGGSQQQGRIHQQPQPAFPIDSCVRAAVRHDVTDGHPHGIIRQWEQTINVGCCFDFFSIANFLKGILQGNHNHRVLSKQ